MAIIASSRPLGEARLDELDAVKVLVFEEREIRS
jgi:hypothetical protein